MTKIEILQMVSSHGESLMQQAKKGCFTVLVLKRNVLEEAIKNGSYSECLYTLEAKNEQQIIRKFSDLDCICTKKPKQKFGFGDAYIEMTINQILKSKYKRTVLFELGFVYDGTRIYKEIKKDGNTLYIHLHSYSEFLLEITDGKHTLEHFLNIESVQELENFISIIE